jgi:hypothetical protein
MFREKINNNPASSQSVAKTFIDMRPAPMKTEKINSYKFHHIPSEMKKEFGSIRKGTEKEYLNELLPIEQAILKFHMQSKHGGINDLRVMEAIKICLLRIRGYLAGVRYDCGKLAEPESVELADHLAKTFDPFLVQEIRDIATQHYDIDSIEGLRRFFEIPVRCLLRILDSVEDRSRMGARGYLEFIRGQIEIYTALEDPNVHFSIRLPEEA